MVKNKRGWIKILEVFLAIILLFSIFSLVISKTKSSSTSETIIEKFVQEIFMTLSLNENLREKILLTDISNPDLTDANSIISAEKPEGVECKVNVCAPTGRCSQNIETKNQIYSYEELIFATKNIYSPRKLKIWCYNED